MDNTKVMAYFEIFGEMFSLDEVTNKLGIEPTEKYLKGDVIVRPQNPNIISTKTHFRKESAWKLSTGYQESNDINDQLNALLNVLEIKQKELLEIKSSNEVSFLFMIVIEIENSEKPAMYLENRIISLASSIGAEIHFDLYIFS